jgi:hypothetical protein
LKSLDRFAEIAGLTVALDEFRFKIEQVDVAGCAGHEKLYHPFDLRKVVQSGAGFPRVQEAGERDSAEASPAFPQKIPPVKQWSERGLWVEGRVHGENGLGGAQFISVHEDEFVQV